MSVPDQTLRDLATDTERSFIVQAPAGSGKTTLLVARYLKLLSRAEQPEQILAITFTRKAAAEMRQRILNALQAGTIEAKAALERDALQNWQLISHPNRLKIQTIDSFAMTLTRQLPVTSTLDPGARLMEDASLLYEEACSATFGRLYQDDPLADQIAQFLAMFGNDAQTATRLVSNMLARRDQWLDQVRGIVDTIENPEQVAAALQQGLFTLEKRVTNEFNHEVDSSTQTELRGLMRLAAQNLDVTIPDDWALYRFVGNTFTTATGHLRQSLNRNQGFPPNDVELKQQGLALLETLRKLDDGSLIANLRYLPVTEISEDTLDAIMAICVTLVLATVALNDAFVRTRSADFTQLLLAARAALQDSHGPTELALALDYRIRHVLVDEFQDTSVSQFNLFELLVSAWIPDDGSSFFAVGDPMQSIYRFRDAEVSLFFDAWQQGINDLPLERVRLTSNFRAAPALVRWTNETFVTVMGTVGDPELGQIPYSGSTPTRTASELAGANPQQSLFEMDEFDDAVHHALFETERDHIDAIVERLEKLLKNDAESSIGLLVRSRSHLVELLPALRTAGIDWQATDIDPLTTRPVVCDLLNLVRAISNPRDQLAWFSVLRAPWAGLSRTDLETLREAACFPDDLGERIDRLSRSGAARLERCLDAFTHTLPLRDEVPPRSLLEILWLRLGGVDGYPEATSMADAERLFELVDSLAHQGLDGDVLERALRDLYASDAHEARLKIMTIHKAKGLEFDHVLLPFLDRTTAGSDLPLLAWRAQHPGLLIGVKGHGQVYDWLAREDKARGAHELERLLYVACTRARDSLHLFATLPPERARPSRTSLLHLLWHVFETQPIRPSRQTDGPVIAPKEHVTARFLPDDYRWSPTDQTEPDSAAPAPAAETATEPGETFSQTTGLDSTHPPLERLHTQPEVALGLILHRTLQYLTGSELPREAHAYTRAARKLWREQLQQLGVNPAQHEWVLDEISRQLALVLADETGQWLLGERASGECELPLTDALTRETFVLDRTFVDDDGTRWVIDYKSARQDTAQSDEHFINQEVARYRAQLTRYGELARAAFDEPVRLAIYLTALPRLRTLDEL